MSPAPRFQPVRVARPLGLLSRAEAQLPVTRSHRTPLQYGRQPRVRSFYTPPAAVAVLQATQDAIISLHSITHMPWFLMIPCVAIGISAVFRLPFNAHTHSITQRRSKLGLVLRGWKSRIEQDVHRDGFPMEQHEKEVTKRIAKAERRIYRILGLQWWKIYSSLLGFPFWLLGIDSIRRICGGPRGIIGSLILGRGDASSSQGAVEAATASTADANHLSAVDPSTASSVAEPARHLPDPSIAVEGCLWFPDLTVADPYNVLPFALSVVVVAKLLPKTRAGLQQLFGLKSDDGSTRVTPATEIRLRLRRSFILASSMIGPITVGLPAALHLYWLSSSATHWVTVKILSYFMPTEPKGVERCKGVELNVIRPKRTEKTSPKTSQINTKE
ncbi:hypothetical protein F5Y05DRAFT_160012 [Hypoxylon sp. FL0543]|nr:hypothetical protein F5Y05DRAFT_160012 [Hypoxylon sp. FL0543]